MEAEAHIITCADDMQKLVKCVDAVNWAPITEFRLASI